MDGGSTFSVDQRIEQAPHGVIDIWSDAQLTICPESGNVVAAWLDDRSGARAVFAATSSDGGASWVEQRVTPPGMLRLTSTNVAAHEVDGRPFVAYAASGYYTGELFALHSLDGGSTWQPPLLISNQVVANGVAVGPLAYNARYANWISAWSDGLAVSGGTKQVFAGGFRPATVEAVITSAPTLHFELSGFSGAAPWAAVLLSMTPGALPLPFGDGRNLGLGLDPLLSLSVGEAFGILGTDLVNGAGATPVLPIALPPGFTMHAVAVSLGFSPDVQFDQITDVVLTVF